MLFVVVTLNRKAGRVVTVDGPFTVSMSAKELADALNEEFAEKGLDQFRATAQVVSPINR